MKTSFALILVLAITSLGFAAEKDKKLIVTKERITFEEFIDRARTSTVFLGNFENGRPRLTGTGFLTEYDDGEIAIHLLVTAKHVIRDPKSGNMTDDDLLVFFNKKGGGYTSRSVKSLKAKNQVKWVLSKEPDDMAVLPFHLDKEMDVKVLRSDLFLTEDYVHELMDVFFVSYEPPGIVVENQINPIMRRGMISKINKDRTIYIDGFAFPGNSGGPVFVKPVMPQYKSKPDGSPLEGQEFLDIMGGRLIGIIGKYIPYRDLAFSRQTGTARVSFEEHSGLSIVSSTDCLLEIFKSQEFLHQYKKLR